MNPLPIITLVAIGTLYGLAWHDQPSRIKPGESDNDSASSKVGGVDWAMVAVWSFVFLSFAALFLAGCIIWINCCGN